MRSSWATPFLLTMCGWSGTWAAALGLLGPTPPVATAVLFFAGLVAIPVFRRAEQARSMNTSILSGGR
ncbi:hypothetical protein RA307_12940 [Xanthobacteraceae bacterium Astr-EGSB]|uniref:hypothetical protein n=1 Tax=Astrobacterium formosum TaxID=3069710 RepID=UPI0027B2CBA5|nr:hypothetical protein [Xanthobacteraceae bacterium Astr-EGSB]